jgi:hypothetical protein
MGGSATGHGRIYNRARADLQQGMRVYFSLFKRPDEIYGSGTQAFVAKMRLIPLYSRRLGPVDPHPQAGRASTVREHL